MSVPLPTILEDGLWAAEASQQLMACHCCSVGDRVWKGSRRLSLDRSLA